MQHICSVARSAIDKYNMIDDGDRIAVGVSGGKDSMVLLYAMHLLSKYYPKKFTVTAVTVDPCFNSEKGDFSEIERFCEENQIPYYIKRAELYRVVFEDAKEKNPCSLCAKMRRGILHNMTKELNCNKIALGHHEDDAVQTFLLNLLYTGSLQCFSPVTYLSNKDIHMIRPLIHLSENEIEKAFVRAKLPLAKSRCPVDKKTQRQRTKELLAELENDFPDIKAKIITAMKKHNLSGW